MSKKVNGITLESFVQEYNNRVQSLKDEYVNNTLIITPYVSIAMKDTLARKLVNRTVYKLDDEGNATDEFELNSPGRYLFFTLYIIDMYTNIEINYGEPIKEYDMLTKDGLISVIMSKIPQQEINEFNTIVDMVFSDTMQNEFTTQQFIRKEINRIGDIVKFLAPITESIVKPVIDKIGKDIAKNMKE